jgi:hypothetical protein
MKSGEFLVALGVVGYGDFSLCWPRLAWEFHYGWASKGGVPSPVGVLLSRLAGVCAIAGGVMLLVNGFA